MMCAADQVRFVAASGGQSSFAISFSCSVELWLGEKANNKLNGDSEQNGRVAGYQRSLQIFRKRLELSKRKDQRE